MLLSDIEILSRHLQRKLTENVLDPSLTYILARDQAVFKVLFFSADRAADLFEVLTPSILRFPDNSGFLLNHVWTKTLRSGDSNVFALKRGSNKLVCPVYAIELYFSICRALNIDISTGFLFRSVSKEGLVSSNALKPPAAQARLNVYLKDLEGLLSNDHFTLHGFRSGAAVSMALANVSLDHIMDHVGWKSSKTALHYIKLQQVFNPAGPAAKLADLDSSTATEYKHINQLVQLY